MKYLKITFIIFYCFGCYPFFAQDTVSLRKISRAVIETAGINIGIGAFNRFIARSDFAYIDFNTMNRNLRLKFVWDNDLFTTNLFGHPYHGGLYFNAARSNGMSFCKSIPYSVAGSLMWEYLMENEPPSLNDLISTPAGGLAIGEITFRISNLLIDNRATGFDRFRRELLAGIISPIHGLNRIVTGDAWKIRNHKTELPTDIPFMFHITAGHRILVDVMDSKIFDNDMAVDLGLDYGCLFSDDNEKPYDAFVSQAVFDLFSGQPVIGKFNVIGQLWGENIHLKNERINANWGIFQHFYYHDANMSSKKNGTKSHRIAETAALGIGGQLKTVSKKNTVSIFSAYINAVLLGGFSTDYYNVIERDYNMGSGFSVKINTQLHLGTKATFALGMANYRLFAWKGYAPEKDLLHLTHDELLKLNVQGDRGNVLFIVGNLNFKYCLKKHYLISIETVCSLNNSLYKHYPNAKYRILESKLGLGYMFGRDKKR
jgi:hypothetical protein